MSRLDDLPPDQRAVLQLLVRQGKSHAEIAEMLGIPTDAVRDRARAALDALAQEPGGEPRGAARAPAGDVGARARDSRSTGSSAPAPPPPPAPAPARQTRDPGLSGSLPSSRRAGALLLAALVVVVLVAVVLITSGGGSHKASSTQSTGTSTSATTTTPSASKTSTTTSSSSTSSSKKPTLDKQIALTSPEPNSKTVGLAEVLSEGSKRAFYIAAEHLPPSNGFFYAVWLYDSPTSFVALGKIPPVSSNGQAQGGALLPANAGEFHEMLLTRETNEHASKPGPVVLSGAFSLGGH